MNLETTITTEQSEEPANLCVHFDQFSTESSLNASNFGDSEYSNDPGLWKTQSNQKEFQSFWVKHGELTWKFYCVKFISKYCL